MTIIDYSEVIRLYSQYLAKYSKNFTFHQKNLSEELLNKLNDLNDVSNEIVQLINELTPNNRIEQGEGGTDIVTIGPFKLTLKRADPNLPIKLDNSTTGYARSSGSPFVASELRVKERKLERLSVEYYRTADRITHIVELLPDLTKFKCKKIRIIRNQLIEHPEGKDSGVTYDSFAYSTTEGPYIKGSRVGKYTNFMDKGFRLNSQEFINKFTKVLKPL